MQGENLRSRERINPMKLTLAVVLSIAMLVSMTPNMAPSAMFADDPAAGITADTGDTATQDGGADSTAPKGENGNETATGGGEPASLYSVSFILPSGYSYSDGTNKFTVQVAEGDTVAKASIPVPQASDGNIFTGWQTSAGGSELFLSPDRIAAQPVTSDVEYTAVFSSTAEDGNNSDANSTTNNGKSKRGVSPMATDWTTQSAGAQLGTVSGNFRVVDPNGNATGHSSFADAITKLQSATGGGTWVLYVGANTTANANSFATGLSGIGTLVVTGSTGDAFPTTGNPQPATSAANAGSITLTFAADTALGVSLQLRNIRHTISGTGNRLYANGHNLTLGHMSWATEAIEYYGGGASGTVAGNPTMTVWSTGTGASTFVGGMRTGTLNGNTAINIGNTSANYFTVFGAGYGTGTGDQAYLNGSATTRITGMSTSGSAGLDYFVGGVQYGNVTGKISSHISGPGRWRYNALNTSDDSFSYSKFVGGSRRGNIGTSSTRGSNIIESDVDTSQFTYGSAYFIGANLNAGVIQGNIYNRVKAASNTSNNGTFHGFQGGGGNDTRIGSTRVTSNTSRNSSTGEVTVNTAAVEAAASFRVYGNITSDLRAGNFKDNYGADGPYYTEAAGIGGYIQGNTTINVGTEDLVYGRTSSGSSSQGAGSTGDIVDMYAVRNGGTPGYNDNGYCFDIVGGGGYISDNNSILIVGNTTLNMIHARARWTYGGSFGGVIVGNTKNILRRGMVDTLEGAGYQAYAVKGNSRAEVYGGEIDWFLTGGSWSDEYINGNSSVEVFDVPRTRKNGALVLDSSGKKQPAAVINASMGGGYGDVNLAAGSGGSITSGDSAIVVHGGDFSGAARTGPSQGFAPGYSNHGFLLGNTSMTLDLRGNDNGFKVGSGDLVSATRTASASAYNRVGGPGKTATLNVLADPGRNWLNGLSIYGDANTTNSGNNATLVDSITININAPGSVTGNIYATNYTNINSNQLRFGTTVNLVSAGTVGRISTCGPSDNITNTVANATSKKAVLNVGPQSADPANILGDWEPGVASDGFPRKIYVDGGISNFTSATIGNRLLIAQSGNIANGGLTQTTTSNHNGTYDNFGNITLKEGGGLGAAAGTFIAGKVTVEEDGYVISPGAGGIWLTDVSFNPGSHLKWLRTGSTAKVTNFNPHTAWFDSAEGWRVITFDGHGATDRANATKMTPANFSGQDLTGGKTYVGDNQRPSSGNQAYGVTLEGAFYEWDVVPGEDASSLGNVYYEVDGSPKIGTDLSNGPIDIYGTSLPGAANASKHGSIAIPGNKSLYPKFFFVPDAPTGEWVKDLMIQRSDHYFTNPVGANDYHEGEQPVSDYHDPAIGPVRKWQPAGNDKEYSFDITVDYTSVPELDATSAILKESQARALVTDGSGGALPDADIVAAIKGSSATNVKGRPFLTDDIVTNDSDNIVTNDAFHALSTPLAPGEYTRTYQVTYYTHNVDSNATSGDTVTKTKTVSVLIVPEDAEVTTGAALVAYNADMLVSDARGIEAQYGNDGEKKNIDYWTGANAFLVTTDGGIDIAHPSLTDRDDKIAAFQGTTAKSDIPLTYTFTSLSNGVVLSKPVTAYIVGARIEGILWVDTNGNGSIDAAEADRFIGKNVKLYAQDGTLIDTAQTDAYGIYSFGAYSRPNIPEGTVYVIFPDLSSYGMTTHDNTRRQNITVNYTTDGNYDYRGENGFNGGYKWPDTSGLSDSFSKKVYDAASGSYVDDLKVTDSNTVLQYRLQFTLPSDIKGYESLTVRDIMPAGLVYASGEANPFVIRVGGSTPTDGTAYAVNSADIVTGTLAGDPARTQVTYNIVDFQDLAGETVNVYIKAKLAQTAGSYPDSVENTGQLILNAPDPDEDSELGTTDPLPPDGLVTGGAVDREVTGPGIGNGVKITGILWDDENGDGIINEDSQRFDSVRVMLYAATDSALSTPLAAAVTDTNGEFTLDSLTDGRPIPAGSYVARYPYINNYGFVLTSAPDQSVGSTKTNVQTNNGASHPITLDLNTNQGKSSNAGYKQPDINTTSEGAFSKDLVSVGGEATQGPIYESTADLVYDLTYTMPSNAAGYNAVEIRDIMDAGLVLKDSDLANIVVKVDGTPVTGGTKKYEEGTTGVESGKWVASYKFADDYDFASLAGKTITMTVTANLAQVSGAWPTSVVNTGRLIINDATPIDKPDTESNTGRIYGTVYNDTDYSGTKNGSETGIAGMDVVLKQWNGSAYVDYAPTSSDTAVTNADGEYSFNVPEGKYRIEFPTPYGANNYGITTSAPNAPVSGVVEDIDISLGDASQQTRRIEAGYNAANEPSIDEIVDSFKKEVKTSGGTWANTRVVSDFDGVIDYKVSFTVPQAPPSGGTWAGFSSIQLDDVLGDGLTLANVSAGAWNVRVQVGADDSTAAVVTQTAVSGSTASYTFGGAQIQQYLEGKAPGTEVVFYVKANLAQTGDPLEWPTSVTNHGILTINAADSPDKDVSVTLTVAGSPPEFNFTQYPLVLAQTPNVSTPVTTDELKSNMEVTDDVDNPTWEADDATDNELFVTRTAVISLSQSGTPVTMIDKMNIGVYKATYRATDINGNETTTSRAIVVDDGRYTITPDDNGGIIIGARNFVAKQSDVTGNESQARSWSWAEAFKINGDSLNNSSSPTWGTPPSGYVANAPVATYTFVWSVPGYSTAKTVTGRITGATWVDPGNKDSQYALIASDFTRNTTEARAMLESDDLNAAIVAAASAEIVTLVPGAPDRTARVVTAGDATTGPFHYENAPKSYPIVFGSSDTSSPLVGRITGTVSDGGTPILIASTPVEIQKGDQFSTFAGVTANDAEDGDISTNVAVSAASAVVDTNVVGLYHIIYEVEDSDFNHVTAERVVVVNDGTYVVGGEQDSRILEARSFITKLADVTTNGAMLNDEIKSKSGSKLWDGKTGSFIDTGQVLNSGGYNRAVGEYNITIGGVDNKEPTGFLMKPIIGKVVDADVIEGPSTPDQDGAVYYAYGKNRQLTISEADDLDTDEKILDAISAKTEKVMPNDTIVDSGRRVKGIVNPSGGNTFGSATGTYFITIADSADPEHITATLQISVSQGEPPVLTLDPVPIEFQTTTAAVNLTNAQIMSGVTATDAEDDADESDNKTTQITIESMTASGQAVTNIPADTAGVYKVTYKAEDSDGNTDIKSRAVIVNDGSIQYNATYIIQAKSFIIGRSEVDRSAVSQQILERSEAKAWRTDGTPAVPEVTNPAGYGAGSLGTPVTIGHYSPVIGAGGGSITKQIDALVVDDDDWTYENGVVYSINAKKFRINLPDAATLADKTGTSAYAAEFIARAFAEGYNRTGSDLVRIATDRLQLDGAVVKKDNPNQGQNFDDKGFADGDVYLATFSIVDEPATKVTIEVLVSSANPPSLFVPEYKSVSVGAVFPDGARSDASPSYRQGVYATDIEDVNIDDSAISHDSPVDTSTRAAFTVTYSVTDSDHNTTTQGGVVLVGYDPPLSGYAIYAHDFSKPIGDVIGTQDEIITESAAEAIDVRQRVSSGGISVTNPNYGMHVPVKVVDNAGSAGYYAKVPTTHAIVIAVNDPTNPQSNEVTKDINATIERGNSPDIVFTADPLVIPQTPNVQNILTSGALKAAMQVTDVEDYPAWSDADGREQALFTGTTYTITQDGSSTNQINTQNIGVYKVTYTATDSNGNSSQAVRAVVVDDGRFIIDPDDNGGIIIGARNFVAKQDDIDGSESQARSLSYAKAYTKSGDRLTTLTWASVPINYGSKPPVADYGFTWRVPGYSTVKTIVGTITGADVVDPGSEDSQYALVASHFQRNTVEAQAMVDSGVGPALVLAADARVIKLLPSVPDRTARVYENGNALTGPFSAAMNTYPIRFAVDGLPIIPPDVLKATINGVVSDGNPPTLNVSTPVEVPNGGAFATFGGVTANDIEDGDITASVRLSTESAIVDTNVAGLYHLVYQVEDSDHNIVTAQRVVVVNDGTYIVNPNQNGRILEAHSFVAKLSDVTASTSTAIINSEIKGKSRVKLFDGVTGGEIDATSVKDNGNYHREAYEYPIVMAGVDQYAADGEITKNIIGKVVDADVIVGPSNPDPDGAVYYAYGRNLSLTVGEAAALDTDALLLDALEAHTDKVMPNGTITDAGRRIKSITGPAGSSFSSAVGTYYVTITDSADPGHVEATLQVSVATGGAPVLTLYPVPLVYDVTTAAVNLTASQIMSGATATDAEDDADPDDSKVTTVTYTGITASGQAVEHIPADEAGVYKVTYMAKDSDGNEDVKSRAVVVKDSSILVDEYILQAKSFIIEKSEVNTAGSSTQAREKSEAKAWDMNGDPTPIYFKEMSAYGTKTKGNYALVVAVQARDTLQKEVQARVVDDDYGEHGTNGDLYSISANDFRINLIDADLLAAKSGSEYEAELIQRALAASYDRTGSSLNAAGHVELDGAVVKTDDPLAGKDFIYGGFSEGDYYTATFRVVEEPNTKLSIQIYVSNANPPVLTVPESKVVSIGAVFVNGAPNDTEPSYMQGVNASDTEDIDITHLVTHSGIIPLDTSTTAAFTVTYHVTDSDHNSVSQPGVILVGSWSVISGYAITAHDFSKPVGDVLGTPYEIITESAARAIDLRQKLPGGAPNPNVGQDVPVMVNTNAGSQGYYDKVPTAHAITLAVNDPDNPDSRQVTWGITATIEKGDSPVITFTSEPLQIAQTPNVSNILTAGALKAAMQVTDAEDYPTWVSDADGQSKALFTGTTYTIEQDGGLLANIDTQNIGVYKLTYTATDSHGNTATAVRAVVVTDGRFIIDPNDNGGIIIGAKNFVAKQADVDGSESQARSWSYAKAYTKEGDRLPGPTWTARPAGYDANAPIDDYTFVWKVDGYDTTKSIVGKVTGANEVDNGGEDSQYALLASHFQRNTTEAQAMVDDVRGLNAALVEASNAQVVKLVATAPDRAPQVYLNGDATTGPFSAAQNVYPIRFRVEGMPYDALIAIIQGTVSDGNPPILTVTSPIEIQKGGTFTTLAGVTATDIEDGDPANGYDITASVVVTAGSVAVNTDEAGLYHIVYEVEDSDHNKSSLGRVVVVNDGTYVVNPDNDGRILKASSFVTRVSDVTTNGSLLNNEILGKSGATLYNGRTGGTVDGTSVGNAGGYHAFADVYDITINGWDQLAPGGYISKDIKGKVVDADVIAGPSTPDPDGAVYYAYGKNLSLTVGEAAALDTDALLLGALEAHTDKVLPGGAITDSGVRVKSVAGPAASPDTFSSAVGTYYVTIADSASPEHISAVLTVSVATGNAPVLTLYPTPLEYQTTSAATYLSSDQIMSGATATDVEDDEDPNDSKVTTVTYTGITTSGQAVTHIPADEAGVYKVTYIATDSDGNEDVKSRAIIVNDGSVIKDQSYILQAKSFIIHKTDVNTAGASAQVREKSEVKAWDIDGTPTLAFVNEIGGYGIKTKGSYFPHVAVAVHPELEKVIEAKVVDNELDGTFGENGDIYSIQANRFRINLTDAAALAGESGSAYGDEFIRRAIATGYFRIYSSLSLVANSVELDGAVVKKAAPNAGEDFHAAGFADGDIYLATFRIKDEPDTKVTIEVTVSDGNPPTLDVPESKIVSVGALFPEGAYGDAAPSYMQGVSVSDIEDVNISPAAVTHDSPVTTVAEAAFLVTYSVTDSDHNTVTQAGAVLVGDWSVISGYAIKANDFSKSVGDVLGTDAEIITESAAQAMDVRHKLPDNSVNPNYGNFVPVKVNSGQGANDYHAKTPGEHGIVIAVDDPANPDSNQVTKNITATIGAGAGPAIVFTAEPLIIAQTPNVTNVLTAGALKAAMQVTDAEDYPTWGSDAEGQSQDLFTGTTYTIEQDGTTRTYIDTHDIGVYKLTYTATDSHGNTATETRAVVVDDGRFIIDPDDNGGIIIGARNYVVKRADVDGTESQARSLSYAKAYNNKGERLTGLTWVSQPTGYVSNANAGTYDITWRVPGYSTLKPIKAMVTGADVVDPGSEDSQYALVASHFLRNRVDAQAMVDDVRGLNAALVEAANAQVISLVDGVPARVARVQQNGDAVSGPFSAILNTYPIRFAVDGLPTIPPDVLKVTINGVVSDGNPPTLSVSTPVEIMKGAAFTTFAGVSANDIEDNDITANVRVTTDSALVNTNVVGLYHLVYEVTDSDYNTVRADRIVVVNDGTYIVDTNQDGRILEAHSFVTRLVDVTSNGALLNNEILGKSGATLYNGKTGAVIGETAVDNSGGYHREASDYPITIGGNDPAASGGRISKNIRGIVVDADVIAGPSTPDANGAVYYAYGDNLSLTVGEAAALNTDALLLDALGAHTTKVMPNGDISDSGRRIKEITGPSGNSFGSAVGTYYVTIADSANPEHISAVLTVSVATGNAPVLSLVPRPLQYDVSPSATTLTTAQIMSGATATDVEDDASPSDSKVTTVTYTAITSGGALVSSIPADRTGVYKVSYKATDSDGNEDVKSRAIVVNDGSIYIDPDDPTYMLQARSFIIGMSEVDTFGASAQIRERSEAKAWTIDGDPTDVYVKEQGGYGVKTKGSYFPYVAVVVHPELEKKIEARVVDDEDTSYENGEIYSIQANKFRINLIDANELAGRSGAAYENAFIASASAMGFVRSGSSLNRGGTVRLDSVVKKDDPNQGRDFHYGGFHEGDIYLATFRISEETDTYTTVEVLVSDGNKPVLTVPAAKQVSVGETFGDGNWSDPASAKNYRGGVRADDVEELDITDRVTYNTPVDTSTRAAFNVVYSVTDGDHNTVTKAGIVLVGYDVISGYGISAYDFTKRAGEVTGTTDEALSYSQADAIDLRREIGGNANPNYGAHVPMTVKDPGGYSSALGEYNIVYAIASDLDISVTRKATVTAGNAPVLTVPPVKSILKDQFFDEDTTNPSYMSAVSANDIEDGDITADIIHDYSVAYGVDGAYTVTYEVEDSDYNLVTKAGIVLVGSWFVGNTYAIRAYDFSKTLGQVTGTDAEMISFARAESICIDQNSPDYGKAGTVTVVDNGGYSRAVGSYDITFGVAEDSAAQKQITATVGRGDMPTLTVPAYKLVNAGAAFTEAQYMSGVSAEDKEDGNITTSVQHDQNAVNTAVEGYYAVNYWVTDSDGNTARAQTLVLVGPWTVKNGYAIRAYSFSKRVGQVLGTHSEMVSSARAQAVCLIPDNANYGRAVAVSVTNDGNYPIRRVGSYQITFGVAADLGVTKTVAATVTAGSAPTLTVPATRRVALGSGFNYMQGVSASDAEDGSITSKVTYTQTVNTGSAGSYRVTYTVTDSDGNTVQKYGVVLVGTGWVVRGGYALYAKDFARRLSQITGTRSEAISLAEASAVWIADQSSTEFGKYVSVTVTNLGGYKKASGNYDITFAVSAARSVTKTIRASISNDTPRADNITVNPPPVTVNPAPVTINNTPAAPAPIQEITVQPASAPAVTVVNNSSGTAIDDIQTPLASPRYWYLVDLLLAIAAMILGFYLMAFALRRKDDDDLQNTQRGKTIRLWGVLGVALGIVSLVVLLLTQEFPPDSTMKLIDSWAILYAAIFGVELVASIGVNSKKDRDEWEVERNI